MHSMITMNSYNFSTISVKDLKPTRRPETGNLYPGSVIDTLATVRRNGDRPELKKKPKCV